ncbi:hypothetical protein Vadar_024034 [Vaccinium darrowii]|uniref:Uncharacterized protein n=1 Tax=Vaccinium darrowii TaxID=229202 RepID=A0ACB7XCB2_9ERIC|nr:hypothetical protein Vadar_024034 [Vaccinium darrowii]
MMDDHNSVTHSVATNHYYVSNGKLMLISLFALVAICILIALFHSYAGWARRRRHRNLDSQPHRGQPPDYLVFNFGPTTTTTTITPPPKDGLERSVLNSIPTFLYGAASHDRPLECAVCLSEFVDEDLGRVLPNCNHCFHIDCIDMWFYSHSDCPLCRAPVKAIANPVGNVTSAGETSSSVDGSGSGFANVCTSVDDKGVGPSSSLLKKPPELVGIIVELGSDCERGWK